MSFLQNLPIKTRLSLLAGLLIVGIVSVGLLGLNGMRNADHAIDELYHVNMTHMRSLSVVVEHAEDSRSQILLSLQHDPGSPFAAMHDHNVSMHIEAVKHNISVIDEHWNEFRNSPLDTDEKRLAGTFEEALKRFENQGVEKILGLLQGGDFYEANRVVLQTINPALKDLLGSAEKLLALQEQEAEAWFQQTDDAYHSMVGWISGSIALATLTSLLLAYFIISGISRGVREVEQTARRLADGELGARVSYTSRDELGRVADAFNQMAQKFHDAINEVRDSVSQLASAAEETSAVTTQTNAGISQQLSETSQVATAMNQMSATVQEVARNAVEAAAAAREADDTFGEGKQVVDRVISAIGELAGEVESAANVIQQLEVESRNIGSVLDVIKSIAEQTNLLALNAAIEAARAGEQGRGFAVVADEVRTLAGRTQESTQEIEEMISRLQSGTDNAVKVMASGKEMTQVGVEQAAAAGEALQTINAAVERISSMNTQIASAAEEQSSVTDEINRSIVSINEVAEQSSIGAQQTAAASDDLAKLAEQLKALVERFKV